MTNPRRDMIAAAVSACRRLTLEDVRPETIFELSLEESGPWSKQAKTLLAKEIAAYRAERHRTAQVVAALRASDSSNWINVALRSGEALETLVRASVLVGANLVASDPEAARALLEISAALADESFSQPSPSVSAEHRAFLAGRAKVELANALRHAAQYDRALCALDDAEELMLGHASCTHELGRAWLVRGSVLFKMDGLAVALRFVRLAANIFNAVADLRRVARTRVVEGNILFEQGFHEPAKAVWLAALPVFQSCSDYQSYGATALSLAFCEIEDGAPDHARDWAQKAEDRFRRAKRPIEIARTHWARALCSSRFGSPSAGVAELIRVRRAFARLKVPLDAAMVDLDVAEAYLRINTDASRQMAARLCEDTVNLFARAGAKQEVVKALTFLAEATASSNATPLLFTRIRRELRQAEREPSYRFEPMRVA